MTTHFDADIVAIGKYCGERYKFRDGELGAFVAGYVEGYNVRTSVVNQTIIGLRRQLDEALERLEAIEGGKAS